MTAALSDEPESPSHAPSMYFVTCFSEEEDDLSQWRAYCGGENGYAIGFRAAGLFGRDPLWGSLDLRHQMKALNGIGHILEGVSRSCDGQFFDAVETT